MLLQYTHFLFLPEYVSRCKLAHSSTVMLAQSPSCSQPPAKHSMQYKCRETCNERTDGVERHEEGDHKRVAALILELLKMIL